MIGTLDMKVGVGHASRVLRVRSPLTCTMAVLVSAVVTTGCIGPRDAKIYRATLQGDRTLVLELDACNGSNEAKTTERPDQVRVDVRTDDAPGGDDCSDVITIQLNEPLGDRPVIDGSTGRSVELLFAP
jgi:hypothetical protein